MIFSQNIISLERLWIGYVSISFLLSCPYRYYTLRTSTNEVQLSKNHCLWANSTLEILICWYFVLLWLNIIFKWRYVQGYVTDSFVCFSQLYYSLSMFDVCFLFLGLILHLLLLLRLLLPDSSAIDRMRIVQRKRSITIYFDDNYFC